MMAYLAMISEYDIRCSGSKQKIGIWTRGLTTEKPFRASKITMKGKKQLWNTRK
jgi:hypothetical protein